MIKLEKFSESDPQEFIQKLTDILLKKFNCGINDLPQNYNNKWRWGLLYLLANRKLDDYYLLYHCDQIWAGAGGRVRYFNEEKIYQAAFRGFSFANEHYKSLGMKNLFHRYITAEQINRAKICQCKKVIISYNEENKKLFEISHKYIIPRSLPNYIWTASTEPTLFNNINQWLITHEIQYEI